MTSVETAKKLIDSKGVCSDVACITDECPCRAVCKRENSDTESLEAVQICQQFLLEHAAEEASKLPLYSNPVNHPSHYASGGIECIGAIQASMTQEAFCGYLKGNVEKYLWRYEKKVAPAEDLKKASWYLTRLIEEVNDNTPNS